MQSVHTFSNYLIYSKGYLAVVLSIFGIFQGYSSPIEEETDAALITMDKLPPIVRPVDYWRKPLYGILYTPVGYIDGLTEREIGFVCRCMNVFGSRVKLDKKGL